MDPQFRSLGQFLSESLGQQLLIENRPGATGIVGINACAKSASDGYPLCAISSDSLSVLPHLVRDLPYDPKKDFTPVAQIVYFRAILVTDQQAPFNTFREMIAYAKANPGRLNFGSFGEGGAAHQAIEIIKNAIVTRITHVPYKGSGPAIQAVVAGEVDLALSTRRWVLPLIRAGRLKPLALPGDRRLPALTDVPTYKELGIDLDLRSWFGLVGPAGISREIVVRLNREIVKVMHSPAYREKYLAPIDYEAVDSAAGEFAGFFDDSREKRGRQIAELLKAAGYKVQ